MTPETQSLTPARTLSVADLRQNVHEIVNACPVLDMHTHLFAPEFSTLNLWGIDELLTYHYLIAELMRVHPIDENAFWALSKIQQADLVWEHLFVRTTPISEATTGVVSVLNALGLDPY